MSLFFSVIWPRGCPRKGEREPAGYRQSQLCTKRLKRGADPLYNINYPEAAPERSGFIEDIDKLFSLIAERSPIGQ